MVCGTVWDMMVEGVEVDGGCVWRDGWRKNFRYVKKKTLLCKFFSAHNI